MALNIVGLFAPDHKHGIAIVERYNLPLVAARPAGRALQPRLKPGLDSANHHELVPITARRNP
jgi:hypothetical protein